MLPSSASASIRDARPVTHLGTSVVLATVGGYLDAFTYVGHGHVFANAQTGNVVLLGLGMATGSWHELRHLPPILAFMAGIFAARMLATPTAIRRLPYLYTSVLALESAVFFAIGLLPPTASDFWITLTIAFIASIQVALFDEVNGAHYNSTFTTGNLRTLCEHLFDLLSGRRKAETAGHARDFASICVAFLSGALLGALLTPRLHNRALWAELLLLLPLMLLFFLRRDRYVSS